MIKPEIYSRNKFIAIGKKTVVIPLVRELRRLLSTMPAQEEVLRYIFDSNQDIAMQVTIAEPENMSINIERFSTFELTYKVRFIIESLSIDVEREILFEDDLGSCVPHLIDALLNKLKTNDNCNDLKVSLIKIKPCLYTVEILTYQT